MNMAASDTQDPAAALEEQGELRTHWHGRVEWVAPLATLSVAALVVSIAIAFLPARCDYLSR
jgi:hypothetical protein